MPRVRAFVCGYYYYSFMRPEEDSVFLDVFFSVAAVRVRPIVMRNKFIFGFKQDIPQQANVLGLLLVLDGEMV